MVVVVAIRAEDCGADAELDELDVVVTLVRATGHPAVGERQEGVGRRRGDRRRCGHGDGGGRGEEGELGRVADHDER